MGMMGVTHGIKTGVLYILDAGCYLLVAERMRCPELMFVFAYAVDEYGLSVEIEPAVAVVAFYGPAEIADTVRC